MQVELLYCKVVCCSDDWCAVCFTGRSICDTLGYLVVLQLLQLAAAMLVCRGMSVAQSCICRAC